MVRPTTPGRDWLLGVVAVAVVMAVLPVAAGVARKVAVETVVFSGGVYLATRSEVGPKSRAR